MNQDVNEGDEVRHELFGAGRVFSIDPISSIATIDFAAGGRKRIHASSRFEIVARGEIFWSGKRKPGSKQWESGKRQKRRSSKQGEKLKKTTAKEQQN